MNDGFIATQIKRTNRNLLITLIILFGLGIGLLALSARYLGNVLSGPSIVDRAALLKVTNPDAVQNYYVTIKADRNVDSGFTQITTRSRNGSVTSRSTSGYYRVLYIGDRVLLARTPTVISATTITGAMVSIPGDIQKDIIDDIVTDVPTLKGAFLPYMLDANEFSSGGYVIIAILLALFGLGAFSLFKWMGRNRNPDNHPVLKALARFGQPPLVAVAIDAALPANAKGTILPAQNMILFPGLYGMKATAMDDLAWAYRINTRRRGASANSPAAIMVNLMRKDGRADAGAFGYDEARANALLQQISQYAPWVFLGYTAETEKSWKSNRAGFLKAVEDRKATAMGRTGG